MTAKKYLESVRFLVQKRNSASEHAERIRAWVCSARSSSISGMPTSGEPSIFEQALAKLTDFQNEWFLTAEEYAEQERLVRDQIAMLEDERHRHVLSEHYVYKKTFEQIAEETPAGYRTVCRWHGSALQEFEAVHGDFLAGK